MDKNKNDSGLFQSVDAFDDGWQFGDGMKTVLGSTADLGVNVLKGGGRLVEGLTDLIGHGIAGFADLIGQDEWSDKFRSYVNESWVDKLASPADEYLDKYSIFGDTGDAIGEGIGQVATIILTGGALGAAGVGSAGISAATTGLMGASSMGSGMSEAYNSGANDSQAFFYGVMKGAIDAGTELLFGGLGKTVNALGISRGLSSLDDIVAKKLSSGISNQFFKNIVQFGVKSSAEGLEEALAGIGGAVAKKLTYMSDEKLGTLVKDENLFQQFVVGAVSSGITQSGLIPGMKKGSLIDTTKKGQDFVSGLTANEQKVVDKLFKDAVKEKEADGKKLSGFQKNKIYDSIVEQMEQGDIDVGTIEEIIKEDVYNENKTKLDEEDAILKEYDELGKKKSPTLAETTRFNELHEQAKEIKKNSFRKTLDSRMSDEVHNRVKGSRLEASYVDRARRGEAYQADVSKYKETERATIQKAIDAGFLNNTNKTRRLIDWIAKISAKTGVDVDFTNSERLKKSGFAIDGKTINGYKTKNGIGINMQSRKILETVVGHELTHVFEGTELYNEMQKALYDYADAKGELQTRRKAMEGLYKGVEEDIDSELTAELVGDYLFTDQDFINRLANDNRNLFQKIWDEIKHMWKQAHPSSPEAVKLEKLKRAFEKAYEESGKVKGKDTKYSLSKNAKEDLHNALYDINYRQEVLLRDESPSIMTSQKGVKNLPMAMQASHIRENVFTEEDAINLGLRVDGHTHYHGLGEEFFLQIIDGLDNVKEAYRGTKTASDPSRRENYFLLVSEFTDKNGNTINVPVYINEHAQYNRVFIDVNKISTVFGRDHFRDYIDRQIQNNNLVKIKNRNTQASERGALIAPGYGMDASIHSISQNSEKSSVFEKKTFGNDVSVSESDIKLSLSAEESAENGTPIITTKQKLTAKQNQYQVELDENKRLQSEALADYDDRIAKAQAEYDSKQDKSTQYATNIARRIERLKRLKGSVDADFKKRISDIESRMSKNEDQLLRNHDRADRLERYRQKNEKLLKAEKDFLAHEYEQRKETLQKEVADKDSYVSQKAADLYQELSNLKKGVRASKELGYILDHGFDWKSIKAALINLKNSPGKMVNSNPQNTNYQVESVVREMLNESYENKAYELDDIDIEYAEEVASLEEEYNNKYEAFKVANRRMTKQREYSEYMKELVGDTSTWVDKKTGIAYKVNTLRRNLRDIVRDENGNHDYAKADAIYEALQGTYNHNEANLNRESNKIKSPYADMKFTKAEDAYVQMLGEFRHNPDTTLTEEVVRKFYDEHKDSIDEKKVDQAIEMARKTYDDLLLRVNEVLREQGMKEIPYRKGYFPHFTEEKQGFLAKLLNWKTQNNDIPTDIAGITEQFNPNRSWQSFNKQRKADTTDYSFTKGLDSYVHGALDWIYHIEDIQKRRALENYIRYNHSEKGVQERIDAILRNEAYDADEMQEQIDLVYRDARNPLNNFVTDLRAGTNRLANKKSSLDRSMEEMTNRKIYSTMTNISNRVTGNMVAGSVSSALTNFIPITQSWGEVSPLSTLRAMGDTIKSIAHDDGMIDKSDFLTNRLKKEENLYKTNWDKVGDVLGLLMEGIDNFTAQTVWRSKYLENISNSMSESEAIKNADQFSASVMADRSRGNMPTIFDSKNPLVKTLTAFQLEVNNQYGYMFKDMPQDIGADSKGKLVKGYIAMFLGAYAYNALYSSLTGRDAAFDPIRIIRDLLKDIFDDEEEAPSEIVMDFADDLLEETPFVGGLVGGGRIPISSALPYGEGIYETLSGTMADISNKDIGNLTKEWLNPVYYLLMPMGGGQLKKTVQGLAMFSDDLPVAGSYTDSGNLRFPVKEDLASVAQAAVFGQWANENARKYIDDDIAPLNEKQIQEYVDSGMTIEDYWAYREGLKQYSTQKEKIAYINSLDLTDKQKAILIQYLKKKSTTQTTENEGSKWSEDLKERIDRLDLPTVNWD